MNFISVVILAAIALAVFAAIRYALRHPDPCDTCGGDDPSCTRENCSHPLDERPGYYRDKKLSELWEETTKNKSPCYQLEKRIKSNLS